MDSSISNNNSLGLQTNFLNKTNGINLNNKANSNNSAYYAKKGEPMYLKEMDSDEDGIVSFEEFKDYCDANGISTRDRIKMAEMATSYRTMQAQKKAEKSLEKKSENKNLVNEPESEAIYARRGDGKYDEAMDANNDDKVSYKEYIEYCKDKARPQEKKSNTKFEESEDGEYKISDSAKAVNSYSQNEADTPEGMVNDTV